MAQTIKLRRSSVAKNVPTTAQLDLGELAINTNDGKIYFEKNDGAASIQTIVTTDSQTTGSIEITGNISGSATSTGSFGSIELKRGGTFKIPQPGGGTFKILTTGDQTSIEGGAITLTSGQSFKGTKFQTNEINTYSNSKDAIDIGEGYTGGIRWGYVEIFSNDSNSWTAGQAQLTVAPASGSLEGIKLVGNDLQTGDYIKIQSGSSNLLNITADGNVSGSSTSTGSFGSLVSKGTTTLDGQVFVDTDSGNQPFYITRVGNATEALKIHVDDFNTIFESIQDEASDGYGGFDFKMDGDGSHPDFRILKGSSELLRVEGSGNVGIGETSPDELLHIKSSTASKPVIKLENAGDVTNGAQLHFVMSTTGEGDNDIPCLLYTSPSPRDVEESRMPSSA